MSKQTEALDKKAENARELGLDYEPAPATELREQEPVATLIDHYGFTDGVVRFDGVENMEQLPIGTKFYIAPLAAPVQEKNT